MCLVCVFLMIKKADNVLNNNFLIPFLSLLYLFSSVFIPFSSVFPQSRKPKSQTYTHPHLHRRQRRSTAGLYIRRSSSPLSALQDPASNQAFVAAESSSRILSPPSRRAVFCRHRVVVPNHSHRFLSFLGFFFLYSSPIGWRGVIFVAACPLSLLFPQQKTNP